MPRDARTSPMGFVYVAPSLGQEVEAVCPREKPKRVMPAPRQPLDIYAVVGATPAMVRGVRPGWSLARSRAWLVTHEAHLRVKIEARLFTCVQQVLTDTIGPPLNRQRDNIHYITLPADSLRSALSAGDSGLFSSADLSCWLERQPTAVEPLPPQEA